MTWATLPLRDVDELAGEIVMALWPNECFSDPTQPGVAACRLARRGEIYRAIVTYCQRKTHETAQLAIKKASPRSGSHVNQNERNTR